MSDLIATLTYIFVFAAGIFAGYQKGRRDRVKSLEPRIEELEVKTGLRAK